MKIKTISSPCPESDTRIYPTYYDLLAYLIDEFDVPVSYDFHGAVQYIKTKINNLETIIKVHNS